MKNIKYIFSLFNMQSIVILCWAIAVLSIYLVMAANIGHYESGYIVTWVHSITFLVLQLIPFLVGVYATTISRKREKNGHKCFY